MACASPSLEYELCLHHVTCFGEDTLVVVTQVHGGSETRSEQVVILSTHYLEITRFMTVFFRSQRHCGMCKSSPNSLVCTFFLESRQVSRVTEWHKCDIDDPFSLLSQWELSRIVHSSITSTRRCDSTAHPPFDTGTATGVPQQSSRSSRWKSLCLNNHLDAQHVKLVKIDHLLDGLFSCRLRLLLVWQVKPCSDRCDGPTHCRQRKSCHPS